MEEDECSCESLVKTAEGFIPVLLYFLSVFIFIALFYRCNGKNRAFYWFVLTMLFLFDLATMGWSVAYLRALQHGCSCCNEDI